MLPPSLLLNAARLNFPHQVAGAGVSKCSWGSVVKVEGLTGLRSWAHLLSALCPPAGNAMLHSLHVLHILDSELPAEAMQGCPPPPALFELHLHNCTDGPVGAAAPDGPGALSAPLSTAAAGALLRSAPLLCSLSLRGSFRGQLPEELASLHGLITLDLSRNGLTDLPPWPWLAGEGMGGCADGQWQWVGSVRGGVAR